MPSRLSSTRPFAPVRATAVLTVLLALLAVPAHSDKGRWTAPEDWGGADGIYRHAVHLVLLRGDGAPDHSRVLYWYTSKPDHLCGQELGWSPGNDDCTLAPGIGFTDRGSPVAPMDVFCSGHTQLAGAGVRGQVLVNGGSWLSTDTCGTLYGAFGERKTAIFTAGSGINSGSWTGTGAMFDGRWYPSAVALLDGRGLALSGDRIPHLRVFGGLRNGVLPPSGDVEGDSVLRFGPDPGGRWDPSVLPAADNGFRPEHRWRHSVADMEKTSGFSSGQVFFGGLGASQPLDDAWLLTRLDGPVQAGDYEYQWTRILPATRPLRRSDHTSVLRDNTDMILFGGRDEFGNGRNDVWRLSRPGGIFTWTQIGITTGSIPARYGHAAVYDTFTTLIGGSSTFMKRMLVFGGVAADGQPPTDTKVYELRFDLSNPNLATWHEHTPSDLGDGGPSARYWHSLNMDRTRVVEAGTLKGHVALLFGGKRGSGLYSDELWELWLFRDGTMGWKKRTWGGSAPSARALHAAAYLSRGFSGKERLYINGGELQGGGGDAATYTIAPRDPSPTWQQWAAAEAPLAGSAGAFELTPVDSRVGELYDPVSGQWFTDTGATLHQEYYPVSFLVPGRTDEGGRVYTIGEDKNTYYLDVRPQGMASGDWQQLPIDPLIIPFQTGVMYEPGKVMVAGGREGFAAEYTLTLDTGSLYNQWVPAGDMLRREDHNLVILPSGKVLAVGGTGPAAIPVFRPQLWDPATRLWTDTLVTADRLPPQQIVRGYHSTAILLPDARVLSAGSVWEPRAEIFCPPYLFNANGTPATRPAASGSPQRVRYGAQFSVCLSSSDSISNMCLIRPGAVTHGFDQNQRYVPLTFTPGNFPTSRLTVTAPSDSSQAPPGDYMLFLVNKKGVPSIARWVRMGYSWSEGDITPPARITDLTRDMVTNNAVSLYWTAVGDDGASGTASYADLRRSTSPIDSSNFGSATAVNPLPVPACSGTIQIHVVTGLSPNTTYYFAVKFSDESGNVSLFGNTVSATTLGECCIGEARAVLAREGGYSAGRARDGEGDGSTSYTAGAAPSGATTSGGATLVMEATPRSSALDLKLLAIGGESFEGHALSGGGVLLQRPDGAGQWTTELQYDLPPGSRFALPAPERPTRWVILEPLALEKVLPEVAGSASAWQLDEARHSREGDVTDTLVAAGATPTMTGGDTLTAHYLAAPESASAGPAWLVVLDRPSSGATSTRAVGRGPEPSAGILKAFALLQNQPNPFAVATTIRFALPVASRVRLEVYDLRGRRMRTLANWFYPPGEHQVDWNRRSSDGTLAPPGLYFCRIDAGRNRQNKRMVILP